MSALSLMARGDSKWLKVGEHDAVILSSHAIPGNETNVTRVIDGLLRLGAEVIHSGIADVHATGHAQADELKTYLSIVKPEFFVPVHGEYRHLVAHAKLGILMGVAKDKVLLCEDGDVIELSDEGLDHANRIPAGYLYVDGIVGDVGQGVLRDRKVLAEEGVVVVVVIVVGGAVVVVVGDGAVVVVEDGAVVVVVDTGSGCTSNAPMSDRPLYTRTYGVNRWSKPSPVKAVQVSGPASMAGEPTAGSIINIGPAYALSCALTPLTFPPPSVNESPPVAPIIRELETVSSLDGDPYK
jgi:hypothetical protein